MPTWADICADPNLKDLPYKIETNRFNKILMSPASTWHGGYQYRIGRLLEEHMPDGRIIMECAVGNQRWHPRAGCGVDFPRTVRALTTKAFSLPIAPEICVEILSAQQHAARRCLRQNLAALFRRGRGGSVAVRRKMGTWSSLCALAERHRRQIAFVPPCFQNGSSGDPPQGSDPELLLIATSGSAAKTASRPRGGK